MSEERVGDWLQTFTGLQVYPLDLREEEINIDDIIHSLSHQCRFGGHSSRFYSVAEHSLYVSQLLWTELAPGDIQIARTGLFHDSSETYLIDIPRPIKSHLTNYMTIEAKVEKTIAKKFGLLDPMPPVIKDSDNWVLATEAKFLMKKPPISWALSWEPHPTLFVEGLSPEKAELKFRNWLAYLNYQSYGALGKA
jgi:hypothetical protein